MLQFVREAARKLRRKGGGPKPFFPPGRYGAGVSTPDSQSGNPGSIPGTATNRVIPQSLAVPIRLATRLFPAVDYYFFAEALTSSSIVGNETGMVNANSVGVFPRWMAATSISIASLVFGGTMTVAANRPLRTYS